MAARRRTTLALRLFNLHPIYRGIEARAYSRMRFAFEAAMSPSKWQLDKKDVQRLFSDGRTLLGWLLQPADMNRRDEVLVAAVSRVLELPNLTPRMKAYCIRFAPRRPLGRPSELKLRAVYALEARLARPHAT